MNLGEFKKIIEEFDDDTVFAFSVSNPFSWRGSYDEVAFEVLKKPSTKGDVLEKIKMALGNEFQGYKGGNYRYQDYTKVNFEEDTSSYTDGGYCAEWIAAINGEDLMRSQEERLARLMFR